jgi:hypothetical protein
VVGSATGQATARQSGAAASDILTEQAPKQTLPATAAAAPAITAQTAQAQSNPLLKPTSAESGPSDFSFVQTMFKEGEMEKLPAAQVIEQIKMDPVDHAVMLMESNGDPLAKNPTSSASGLFQLIKKTAENLGVEDVFDPAQNYAGYLKLKEQTIKQFGRDDVATIYSAHYLGAPTLKKWMNGEPLTKQQQSQVDYLQNTLLPRLEKIYGEITANGQVQA